MLIDGNPMEKEAMVMFHQGDDAEGHRLQDAFARAFQEEYQSKDHCPAPAPASTTATARCAWPSTGRTRNTCPAACNRCWTSGSRRCWG